MMLMQAAVPPAHLKGCTDRLLLHPHRRQERLCCGLLTLASEVPANPLGLTNKPIFESTTADMIQYGVCYVVVVEPTAVGAALADFTASGTAVAFKSAAA